MMTLSRLLAALALCWALIPDPAWPAGTTSGVPQPAQLRCEYRQDPLGLDTPKPRLSWTLASDRRGERQTAWQVLVASTPEALAQDQGDLWDSGKVVSDQSSQVEYNGKALGSGQRAWWKVRIWNMDGAASAWSDPASWSMGLLARSDWQAHWIGYDAAYQPTADEARDNAVFSTQGLGWVRLPAGQTPANTHTIYLRKRFDLPTDRTISRAMFVLYADNLCTASVNGVAVGQSARWERTARLEATAAVRAGANAATLVVANSDFLPPTATGKLVVQFQTGSDVEVPLDNTWKAAPQAAAGWDQPGFNDQSWAAAAVNGGTPWGTPNKSDIARIPAPYLRKEFSVAQPVRRATAYVTALGTYELRLNGQRVGQDLFAPGWSDFRKRVYYQTYDVTGQITQGANALGAILGDGWYASALAYLDHRQFYGGNPRLLVQLVLELADGSMQTIISDGAWKAAYGPIQHADLLLGCEYDARLTMPGWDLAGFDDHAWASVRDDGQQSLPAGVADVTGRLAAAVQNNHLTIQVTNDNMGGDPIYGVVKTLHVDYQLGGGATQSVEVMENDTLNLGAAGGPALVIVRALYGNLQAGGAGPQIQAQIAEPSRRFEELPALQLTEPKPGCYTFDLGQNMVGWVRLKVRGAADQRIVVRHGEMLNPDGTLYTANLRGATAADIYHLAGTGDEVLEPYFTFHGFRYVEVRGLTARPGLDAVTGIVVHSGIRRTGDFSCSSALVNQLYHNIIWGQKGNYLEVPTDCPQRDERMGWTGDTQFFAPTANYNFDVAAFLSRWLVAICEDSQYADGSFANVVPDIMGSGGSTAWGDAALICTWNVYHAYGDTRVISDHFAAMDRYMAWVATRSSNYIPNIGGFGDWLNLGGGASREVIDTAYYAYLAGLMREMAQAIGRTSDAQRYAQLQVSIKAAFAGFFNADGSLKNCSQTGYALAFTMGLVPDGLRDLAAARYADEVQRFNWHLATGFIGTPRLLPGLNAAGRDDVAYRLLLQEGYPSWLFQVKLGATTMWERWDGWTPNRGFQDIGMNSFNHYAFGAVGEYLYGAVGGIRAASPGYKTILIQPAIGDGLTWAKASYDSIQGPIVSNWQRNGDLLTLEVAIPANTTATISLPARNVETIAESGRPAMQAEGLTFTGLTNGRARFTAGSGHYVFVWPESGKTGAAGRWLEMQ